MSPLTIHVLLEIYALPDKADQYWTRRNADTSSQTIQELQELGFIQPTVDLPIGGDPNRSEWQVTERGMSYVRHLENVPTDLLPRFVVPIINAAPDIKAMHVVQESLLLIMDLEATNRRACLEWLRTKAEMLASGATR